MRCSTSTPPPTPTVVGSSNLRNYRALLQVLSFAAQRELTAEQLVRDAMTGGVVVPFKVTHYADGSLAGIPLDDTSFNSRLGARMRSEIPLPQEPGGNTLLLMPSSKFIGTAASLLAHGFFCFAPLSSTVEKEPGACYQFRSESQARDLFTLIMLLFPECFVAETLPRTLLAFRDAECSSTWTQSVNRAESEVQESSFLSRGSTLLSPVRSTLPGSDHTPPLRGVQTSSSNGRGAVPDSESLQCSVVDKALPAFRTASRGESPPRMSSSVHVTDDSGLSDVDGLGATTTNALLSTTVGTLPIVDAVALTLDALDVLLESRRSLAIVLLSHINDALREVQFRQLEQSRTAPATGASKPPRHSLCECGILKYSLELLLTAKVLLMSAISASAVWRKRFVKTVEHNKAAPRGVALSPFHVLMEFLGEDSAGTTPFVSLPVEHWVWGKETDALEQWYDRILDRLLVGTDRAGIRLDAYLQTAKSDAVRVGRSVSCFPTLLLHRPSDGQPAVEMCGASLPPLSGSVRLPSLPIQEGELHVLLSAASLDNKTGVLRARGHELLLDSTSSPTADFFLACATSAFSEAQLQPSGDALPALFRRRLAELSSTEQGIVAAALGDPAALGALLEKNAAMLARLTLWCRNRWPPSLNASTVMTSTSNTSSTSVAENDAPKDLESLASNVEQYVLFQHPFSATVGRYVRELVTLRGLSQELLEEWIRHVCAGAASDGSVSSSHRAMFTALVKFAVLHNRWQLNPTVEAIQRTFFM